MSRETINARNQRNIQTQIARKKSWQPYWADVATTSAVLTDFDSFPYTRWWRGAPGLSDPVVIDREAGWRPRQDACYQYGGCKNAYREDGLEESVAKQACFETACSTVFPCFPKLGPKWLNREASNIASNNGRVVEYR